MAPCEGSSSERLLSVQQKAHHAPARLSRPTWVAASCVLFALLLSNTLVVTALELPDDGVSLGSWSDDTARYFGSSTAFTRGDNTQETLSSPPLRVLALTDWQSQRRTELLGTWPNRSSLTLWANHDLANSLVSRTRAAALVYGAVWSTEALPTQTTTAAPQVVSAVGADLIARGDADVLLQASDGSLYALNHSSVSAWTPSAAFSRVAIVAEATLSASFTQLKVASVPSVSVVHDFLPRNATEATAEVGLAFVNADDQLVLLSRVAGSAWPPQYTAHLLADVHSAETGRVMLPLSIQAADVNEDCAAELLYAVRDARQHLYEVHLFNTGSLDNASEQSSTVLLSLVEGNEEVYGDAFTVADVNGDGLPELVLTVQLSNQSSSCAAADTKGIAETCTAYHGFRIFYPRRAAGVSGSPSCRSSSSSSDHHLSYDVQRSTLFALTPEWCGVEGWGSGAASALPLYMPDYPSAPLLLRPGDYNRDRLVDMVVPSSYGPLLLTARDVGGVRPLVCTALDSTTGKEAVQKAVAKTPTATTSSASVLEAYRTATPFFATLSLLGRLEVVLTHHRLRATTTSAAYDQLRVYQNSQVPSRSYFLSSAALTMKSYGASCIGATHHMTWQDIHMRSHWATVTQQGRTQGHALLPPHVLVGLDETFSYVHDYTIGLRASVEGTTDVVAKEWPSYLVPNAQVFAEVFPLARPTRWSLQLYLPTSTYRNLLVIALAIALVVIGLPVVWLRCGEMRRDYVEWRMP